MCFAFALDIVLDGILMLKSICRSSKATCGRKSVLTQSLIDERIAHVEHHVIGILASSIDAIRPHMSAVTLHH